MLLLFCCVLFVSFSQNVANGCGTLTPEGLEHLIGGRTAKHGELPWHAGIYMKSTIPYKQICGATLVSTKAVISAAHCFWRHEQSKQNPEMFAVAVGKIYRPWNDAHDADAQRSNVTEIHIPTGYRGEQTNFQQDIAVVILETEIVYQTFIRPACLSFDLALNTRQLQAGKTGKIASWGVIAATGKPSQVLRVVEMPYVSYVDCFEKSPQGFREYITADKFCAGFWNGTALGRGDGGGGLTFPEYKQGVIKYYLRGVASTAPSKVDGCDPDAGTTFTEIAAHERFIKDHLEIPPLTTRETPMVYVVRLYQGYCTCHV